jgi:hypothetical protein
MPVAVTGSVLRIITQDRSVDRGQARGTVDRAFWAGDAADLPGHGSNLCELQAFGETRGVAARGKQMNPLVNCYAAADSERFWLLGAESDRHWPRLLEGIGRPDLGADGRSLEPRSASEIGRL